MKSQRESSWRRESMDATDPDDLFEAFDPSPASRRHPVEPALTGGSSGRVESAFAHLRHECVASIAMHALDNRARLSIEQVMRECVVSSSAGQVREADIVATPGTVHYFQAFAADYAGADCAMAAAAVPRPEYELLMDEPLPLSTQYNNGRGGRGGRGRGRGGGRSALTQFSGRYYDEEKPAKPGELSEELRMLLGMREGDPPPYLARMKQLGYPPGYLGDPSDVDGVATDPPLELFDDQHTGHSPAEGVSKIRSAGGVPRLRPLVAFPGLNVPPPPGVSLAAWDWPM